MTTVEGTRGEAITPRLTYTLSGKRILVFDDLFTDEFVDTFGAFLLRQDYAPRPSFDNELSAPLPNELLESLPAIPDITAAILERFYPEMTASPAPQTLTHGYSAAIRFGDSCILHRDIACDDCVTFLYYGNLHWDVAWGGETIFYDDESSASVSVTPRPGRLVFFNAALRHRAGVPSRTCPTFRYGLSLFYRCPSQSAVSGGLRGE